MGKSRSFNRPSRQSEKSAKLAEVAMAAGAGGGSSIEQIDVPGVTVKASTRPKSAFSVSRAVDSVLGVLSSVPCGITLLVILITCCMIGMLIEQQELETFAKYYAELAPAEKIIYGHLGFFNIYHVWYFNLLLLLLSLNIILASIDHFPAAWSFVRKKKLTASPTFAQAQRFRQKVEAPEVDESDLSSRAVTAARSLGFKTKVTRANDRTTVFAERGVWNRLGAYAVHVALLTIFTGGFLTSRGHTGGMWVEPGKSSDKMLQQVFNVENATTKYAVGEQELQLPFEIEGVDIQQKLIDKDKGIDAGNTLDWLTRVKIRDERGEQEALIHLNKPYDYRGYRFFQASFMNLGSARNIHLTVTPVAGGPAQDLTIKRNEEAKLADGTRLRYVEFNPHFALDRDRKVQIESGEYKNPAAHLELTKPDGEHVSAWAFTDSFIKEMANAPFLKSTFDDQGGYRFLLLDFEKVPQAHMLSIQYDPGSTVVYAGFGLLCLTLIAVFFFSHQRLWIVVENGAAYLGGDANRNRLSFEDKLKKIAARIAGRTTPDSNDSE